TWIPQLDSLCKAVLTSADENSRRRSIDVPARWSERGRLQPQLRFERGAGEGVEVAGPPVPPGARSSLRGLAGRLPARRRPLLDRPAPDRDPVPRPRAPAAPPGAERLVPAHAAAALQPLPGDGAQALPRA